MHNEEMGKEAAHIKQVLSELAVLGLLSRHNLVHFCGSAHRTALSYHAFFFLIR